MGNIFVCHSRYDREPREFINEVCITASVGAIEFEFNFTSLGRIANEAIITRMETCSALFVLLGRNISRSLHTSNWCSAEVGLAKGKNIPIWVVEDFFVPIDFPVPFVDHYIRINVGDPEHRDPATHSWMQELVGAYGSRPACSGDIVIPGTRVMCSKPDCQAVFDVHQPLEDIIKCPVCTVPQPGGEPSSTLEILS